MIPPSPNQQTKKGTSSETTIQNVLEKMLAILALFCVSCVLNPNKYNHLLLCRSELLFPLYPGKMLSVINTLQSSSSKEMEHTQSSRNVTPSQCVASSRYQKHWDKKGEWKESLTGELSTFTEHISQNYGIWEAKSNNAGEDIRAQCPHRDPLPNTHTLWGFISYW